MEKKTLLQDKARAEGYPVVVKEGTHRCGLKEAPVPVQSLPPVWKVASAPPGRNKGTTLLDGVTVMVTGPHF